MEEEEGLPCIHTREFKSEEEDDYVLSLYLKEEIFREKIVVEKYDPKHVALCSHPFPIRHYLIPLPLSLSFFIPFKFKQSHLPKTFSNPPPPPPTIAPSKFSTMATSTLTPATLSQVCSGKNGLFTPSQSVMVKPTKTQFLMKEKANRITCQASSIPADRVPDMGKRELMNLLLLGALSLPTAGMLVPYATFFAPPSSGGGSDGTPAKDALGNDVIADDWIKTHGPGDRTLTQGLKGDPTYLVVENDRTLAPYGINAVCTHLGCVVPFNAAEKKFICPCHGSQYNNQGRVVRGPAPLSLALAHADVVDGKVVFVPWVETDFRTGENPWWS